MPLTLEQKKFIVRIDQEAKKILQNGGDDEDLLISLGDKLNEIKNIIASTETKEELNTYCKQYAGFCKYIRLLLQLAQEINCGVFDKMN